VLVLSYFSAQGQTITETFGSGASQFSINFVTIGNPGNAADETGFGSVAYTYNLGKYEISRDLINKANEAGGLGITLADLTNLGGNGGSRPATGISWYEAAKFVNYLNTSQNKQVAYKFDGNGNFDLWGAGQYSGSNQFRHKDAYYFLPNVDEWYKGAYYDPNKAGGAGYWNFPTSSDNRPTPTVSGTLLNTAVWGHYWEQGPADVTDAGGVSAYGTTAQGGNVWEWNENAFDLSNDSSGEIRELRGGSWDNSSDPMGNSFRSSYDPAGMYYDTAGFRIASVPEPSSLSLLLAGGLVLMAGRRKKKD